MRLLKLRIKNFRGISCGENGKGIEVRLDDQNIIFLIGKNNIGKSSILYAYDYLFNNEKALIDDFYNKNIQNPIEIEVELSANQDEKEQLSLTLKGNGNPILRRIWESPGVKSKIYIGRYGCEAELVESEKNASVTLLKKDLPEPVWIKGMAKSQEVVAQIQNLVKQTLLDQMKESCSYKEAYTKVEQSIIELQKAVLDSGFTDKLSSRIDQSLHRIFPDISLHISNQGDEFDLSNLLDKYTQVQINDSKKDININLDFQGHGVQRQVVLSAYKECHEFFSLLKQRGGIKDHSSLSFEKNEVTAKTKILLIEEPELFLHPAGVRAVQRLLCDIAIDSPFQVMCATHSPIMVDLSLHSSLVRLSNDEDGNLLLCQLRTNFDLGKDGVEAVRIIRSFNSHVCEAFFSDRVILVEGPTESVVINLLLTQFREKNLYKEDWITVVDCGGKATIPLFQRILRHFGIPYFVFHDMDSPGDEDNDFGAWETKNSNIWEEIMTAKNSGIKANRFVFNKNFETAHPYPFSKNNGGKPYAASLKAKQWIGDWNQSGVEPVMKKCPIVKFLWEIITDSWDKEIHDQEWIRLQSCKSRLLSPNSSQLELL
ncbi:MAG: AAA family ATPase [Alkalinema sp. FL-bin-369]|nr:AAA family ATPase [Leptolyngbyaceae cyanobacterium LF-bin-369]